MNFENHVPNDRGQSAHDGHAGDLGATPTFDSQIPGAQPRVVLERVHHQLSEQEARQAAAFFANRTEPLILFARVATRWRRER